MIFLRLSIGWIKRKLALSSSIDLTIEKINDITYKIHY